jgi:hypothetical protein
MSNNTVANKPRQSAINKISTATARAKLGDVVADLTTQVNTLTTQLNALLTKLDTANLAGMGTTNKATFGVSPTSVVSMENR